VYDTMMRHGSARLSRVMRLVTDLGGDKVAVPLMIAVIGWLAWRRLGRLALTVAAIWGGAKLSSGVTKALFDRERPLPARLLGVADGYSFPSGHTVTAVITYGLIALLLARHHRGLGHWLPIALATVTALAVAVSRVYLGVHYATDVIGGLLLGLAWLVTAVNLLPNTESGSVPLGTEPEPI
jgi:undecaprenyl-diphosphatase